MMCVYVCTCMVQSGASVSGYCKENGIKFYRGAFCWCTLDGKISRYCAEVT